MHASVSMGFHTLPLSKPVFCIKLVYTLDYLSFTFVVSTRVHLRENYTGCVLSDLPGGIVYNVGSLGTELRSPKPI